MSKLHVCCVCGHSWDSINETAAKKINAAVKVNKEGPYCGLCLHLEMAERYAIHRGFSTIEGAVKYWVVKRHKRKPF